jgi:hypothetical protein
MWPASSHYFETIKRSHTRLSYVELLKDGVVVARQQSGIVIDPATNTPVSSIGGSISVDKTTIRRAGTQQLLDVSGLLLPTDVADLFAPFVTEIRTWIGARYWDAPLPALTTSAPASGIATLQVDSEYVPVSTLVITSVANDYPQLTLTGSDRMWSLANFPSIYVVPAGTNVKDALTTLLGTFMPGSRLALNIPDTEHTTPRQAFDANTSIADAAHTLAQIAGWQLYCDPMGTFTATDEPSTDDDPVLTLAPGQFSVMGRPGRSVGVEGELYTAVVFTGEGATTPPVRSYIEDTDPESLTYAARVGVRPYFESSPLITTQAQCDLAARTTLRRILGLSDTIVVPIMPNYALESGDVIHATDPQQGIDTNLIVDAFPIPFRATDGMQMLACRSRVIR